MTEGMTEDRTVMGADVSEALRERLAADDGVERVGEHTFFSILAFDSGCRIGLTIGAAEDAEARWAATQGDAFTPFAEADAIKFVELIEHPRSEIDERIEQGASEIELPPESVLFSLPVVELVRAMLAKNRTHFSRQCLLWLLPSELRALRKEIAELVDNDLLPRQLRDLAERLVVPE